jgi:hypothetical protein
LSGLAHLPNWSDHHWFWKRWHRCTDWVRYRWFSPPRLSSFDIQVKKQQKIDKISQIEKYILPKVIEKCDHNCVDIWPNEKQLYWLDVHVDSTSVESIP